MESHHEQFAIKRKEHSPIISALEPKKKYERAVQINRPEHLTVAIPGKKISRPIVVARKGNAIVGENNMLQLFMKSKWQVNAGMYL